MARKWRIGFLLLFTVQLLYAEPIAVYLTWKGDPTSTMAIQWIEEGAAKEASGVLSYRKLGDPEVHTVFAQNRLLRKGIAKTPRLYWVEITRLGADSDYVFWLEDNAGKVSREYRFHTLPQDLSRPLRFAVGGDVYFDYALFCKMNAEVARQDPAFVVLGGDIAYAYGHSPFGGSNGDWNRWRTFLQTWTEQMVDTEGRLIPLLPLAGNHDVRRNKEGMFYDLFLFDEEDTYRLLDIGGYLSLFLLDSGHLFRIDAQKQWLEEQLGKRRQVPYKIAAFHVPAYPARRDFNKSTPTRIRESWVPLFEKEGVQAVFEHHNHVYKRTVPIKEGKEDAGGVFYLGDGSWGTPPRKPLNSSERWFIAKSAAVNAVFIVDLTPSRCTIRALNNKGEFFDETPPISPSVPIQSP